MDRGCLHAPSSWLFGAGPCRLRCQLPDQQLVLSASRPNTWNLERTRTTPGRGQESAWSFPAAPVVEPSRRSAAGELLGVVMFNVHQGYRVVQRGFAPTYYVACEQTRMELLVESGRREACSHRGALAYWTLAIDQDIVRDIGWTCVQPSPRFEVLRDHIAFFPGALDAAWLDGERVVAAQGDQSRGWVTSHTVGPFLEDRAVERAVGGHRGLGEPQ